MSVCVAGGGGGLDGGGACIVPREPNRACSLEINQSQHVSLIL